MYVCIYMHIYIYIYIYMQLFDKICNTYIQARQTRELDCHYMYICMRIMNIHTCMHISRQGRHESSMAT